MPNSVQIQSSPIEQLRSSQHVFPDQQSPAGQQRPLRGVWQDKGVGSGGRVRSHQPAPVGNGSRAQRLETKTNQVQKGNTSRVPLVHMTLWVHPLTKAEIQRTALRESMATGESVSVSHVGAGLLETAVRQDIHRQQESLLIPTLKQAIREEFRAFGNRIVFFLMRIAFASEQTRILVTKLLHMRLKREGVSEAEFNTVIDRSADMAKRNIVTKTPQMKSLIAAWEGFGEEREYRK
jgi:hypothetical protein